MKIMAFEKLTPEPEYSRYWKPQCKGDYIEGWIVDDEYDSYNNRQIVLKVGEDENGKDLITTLPAHKKLQKFYPVLNNGYYIRVEAIKEVELKDNKTMFIYEVLIDREKSFETN